MLELNLIIDATEGALVRLLGTIERRGFAINQMSSRPHARGMEVRVQIGNSSRPAEVLLRQVRRLIEVREATLDVARPTFTFRIDTSDESSARELIGDFMPRSAEADDARRRLSFLGIPDRISNDFKREAQAVTV